MANYKLITLLIPILLFSCGSHPKRITKIKHNFTGFHIKKANADCMVANDFLDPVTFERTTQLETIQLFSFTHPELKQYFTGTPFMICEGFFSRVGKHDYFLNITFKIQTKNLHVNYNGLSENDMLRINFVNGEKIFLQNILSHSLIPQSNSTISVFSGIYPVEKKYLKFLKKYEIDQFGVMWNGGYEAYDVHEVDFAINQLACFKYLK